MKKTVIVLGLVLLCSRHLFAAGAPRGNLIELHSCELYAGGCVVSSEATLGGRYMLQVWDIAGGSWQGTDLSGLQVALLDTSSDNLASDGTRADKSVVYLPESATPAQREAVIAWLKANQQVLATKPIVTRVVPMSLTRSGSDISFAAGTFASLKTTSLQACRAQACGDDLWYSPRAQTSVFTVAFNLNSQVAEPALDLKWADNCRRTVFVGRFGDSPDAKNLFVQSAAWCGQAGNLF